MHIAHPTLAMWGGGLPVVVSMLRRWKPWRLGLTGGRDTNWTVWWKQTRQHEGFPGPTASFKGRLGPPSVVLWLRLDPGWMAMVLVMQLCLWHCHPGGCRSLWEDGEGEKLATFEMFSFVSLAVCDKAFSSRNFIKIFFTYM